MNGTKLWWSRTWLAYIWYLVMVMAWCRVSTAGHSQKQLLLLSQMQVCINEPQLNNTETDYQSGSKMIMLLSLTIFNAYWEYWRYSIKYFRCEKVGPLPERKIPRKINLILFSKWLDTQWVVDHYQKPISENGSRCQAVFMTQCISREIGYCHEK